MSSRPPPIPAALVARIVIWSPATNVSLLLVSAPAAAFDARVTAIEVALASSNLAVGINMGTSCGQRIGFQIRLLVGIDTSRPRHQKRRAPTSGVKSVLKTVGR